MVKPPVASASIAAYTDYNTICDDSDSNGRVFAEQIAQSVLNGSSSSDSSSSSSSEYVIEDSDNNLL